MDLSLETTGQFWVDNQVYRAADLVPDFRNEAEERITIRSKYDIGSPVLNNGHWSELTVDGTPFGDYSELLTLIENMCAFGSGAASGGGGGGGGTGYPKAQLRGVVSCLMDKVAFKPVTANVSCNAFEICNYLRYDIRYARQGYTGSVTIPAKTSRLIIGIANVNELSFIMSSEDDEDGAEIFGEAFQF